jgi:transposase
MAIVSDGPRPGIAATRFAPVLWHDDHPDRLEFGSQLPRDHLARQIDAVVDRLDLESIYTSYGGTGSLPHPPELLLRAVLYEIHEGQHKPARWHRDARTSVPVRWLLRGCQPSRSCWYTFRDRLAPLLQDLNAQPLAAALALGLTPAKRGAIDGTSVAAHASRYRLLNEANLDKRTQQLESVIAADLAKAAAGPLASTPEAAAAPTPLPPSFPAPLSVPGWMAKQPASRQAQRQRYQQAQQQMAQRQARNRAKLPSKRTPAHQLVVSTSEPEAALGLDKEKVFRPLYNVQLVADLDSPFILSYQVFAQPNDAGLLGWVLDRVRASLGHQLDLMLADTAYAGGADLRAAALAGVTVYAPLPKEADPQGLKQLPMSAFQWREQEQCYVCPQGQRLVLESQGQQRRSGPEYQQVRRFRCPPQHCLACPLQQRCAKNPKTGRTISRSEYQEEIEALQQRMASPEAKALYKLRRETVELVNADWKEHRNLRRFSGRGLARAQAQVGLLVLTHNLLTLLSEEQKAKARNAKEHAAANLAEDAP